MLAVAGAAFPAGAVGAGARAQRSALEGLWIARDTAGRLVEVNIKVDPKNKRRFLGRTVFEWWPKPGCSYVKRQYVWDLRGVATGTRFAGTQRAAQGPPEKGQPKTRCPAGPMSVDLTKGADRNTLRVTGGLYDAMVFTYSQFQP